MKHKPFFLALIVLLLALLFTASETTAQGPTGGKRNPRAALGNAFTYQGQLKSGGSAYSGTCD
ncbi:MAG: hypothetical protein KGJ80_10475, partial [Chloroflexota bacterium]|nr:hypothetical protein [Chloroflexota bacterium]